MNKGTRKAMLICTLKAPVPESGFSFFSNHLAISQANMLFFNRNSDADGLAVPLLFDDPFVDPGPPTDPLWLQQNVLFGNSFFLSAYPAFLATADPQLFATATPYPLPPNIIAALELGLTIPTLGTTLYPPPGILEFLTPAGLLGW